MTNAHQPVPEPVRRRAPEFTLGSALRWLGHGSREPCECGAEIGALPASIWFLPEGGTAVHAVVTVSAVGRGVDDVTLRRAIRDVDRCTRREGIEVRQRRPLATVIDASSR